MENILVCTAWPYANGPLHLGHFAGCFLPADILARYQRMAGNNVRMVSGSDQHGTPITVTAEEEGVSPEEIADRYHDLNSDSLEKMGISYDLFSKTHDQFHFEVVHDIFLKLHEKNYIYKKSMLSPYCPDCERFLPDRYVEGICPYCGYDNARGDQCDDCGKTLDADELREARCSICGSTPTDKETEQFYLRLSHLEGHIWNMLRGKDHWRPYVVGLTKSWLEEGLRDRAITRDLSWGVPIPLEGYDDKCIYVWFEAVIGYLSCTKLLSERLGEKDMWKDFWIDDEAKIYYFLAKDNIPFHTLIFPAMLAGYDEQVNLPYDVPSNQYLTLNSEQFSKSRKHAVWIPNYLDRFPPDLMRYYLSINMPEHKDTDFTWKNFVRVINEDLIANLGNMIHRAMVLAYKYYGEIPGPSPDGEPTDDDKALLEAMEKARNEIGENLRKCRFQNATKALMRLAQRGNEYLAKTEPWKVIKNDPDRARNIVHNLVCLTSDLCRLMQPFLPFTAQKLWKMLGNEGEVAEQGWDFDIRSINTGHALEKPHPLFEKLDLDEVIRREKEVSDEEERKKEVSDEEERKKEGRPIKKRVSFAHFQALDIRIGEIITLEKHPDSKKLYILSADIGKEKPVQMVAGLKKHYSETELEGKKIVVVVNIEPAEIRGVRSEAMLLAAEDEDNDVGLIGPLKDMGPGSRVY